LVSGVKGVVKLMGFDLHLVGRDPRRNGIPQTGVSVPEVMPSLRSNIERTDSVFGGRAHVDALTEIDHKGSKLGYIHNITHRWCRSCGGNVR
jgi:hypothetical protein